MINKVELSPYLDVILDMISKEIFNRPLKVQNRKHYYTLKLNLVVRKNQKEYGKDIFSTLIKHLRLKNA